jgi:hypothetical protein
MVRPLVVLGLLTGAVALEVSYLRTHNWAAAQDERRPEGGPMGPGGFGGPGGPGFGGGPGGGFGGPPGMGGQDREVLKQFDKDENGWLNQEERAEARKFLKENPGRGGRGPGGGGPGVGGPGGGMGRMFDPVSLMAQPLVDSLDKNKDEKLSEEELTKGVKTLYGRAKVDGEKSVGQQDLAATLNEIVPRPDFGQGGPGGPGFGPQGGGGGAGGPEGERPRDERRRPAAEGEQRPPREGGDRNGPPAGQAGGPEGGRGFGGPGGGGPGGGPGGGGFGGGPGFGGPGGGGRGGFGPGFMLAGAIFAKADTDKNDSLTQDELVKAATGLFKDADKNKDDLLDKDEIVAAGGTLMAAAPGGFGGPGGPGGRREPGKPGPKVSPEQVKKYGDEPLYDSTVLRTLFLTFDESDWEKELEEFHGTDVDVAADLEVDGKKYPKVGIHFRGMSSYGMIPAGSKRSFNVSLDLADSKQRLLGYKTLNLLNANGDPSFMSSILYSHISRKHIPAMKANLVKVVVNGESWGVYVNVQQYNKEFLAENYPTSKGTRWKVSGSPGSSGGLEYFGDNVEEYKRRFELKTGDGEKAWTKLIELCRVLNETPTSQLEAAIEPILDVEGTLWFLAIDVALINSDGYWVRSSDYNIYLDPEGKFHIISHDMNEALRPGIGGPGGGFGGGRRGGGMAGGPGGPMGPGGGPMGPGGPGGDPMGPGGPGGERGGRGGRGGGMGPGGPGGGGLELDPLVALDDSRKPLRSKLLAVPKYRARYLEMIKEIAEKDLDWKEIGPIVEQYRSLAATEVKADTRKLSSYEGFETSMSDDKRPAGGGGREMSIRSFVEQRREFLLKYQPPKK